MVSGNSYKPGTKARASTRTTSKKPTSSSNSESNNRIRLSDEYFEALAEYRKDRTQAFLTFAIPAIAIAAAVGLGIILYLFAYKTEIQKEWSSPFTGPLFMAMLVVSVLATVMLLISYKVMKNSSDTSILVWNAIMLALIIVASPVVLSQLAAVIERFGKHKINFEDYWMIYLVPCFQYIIAFLLYTFTTIGRNSEKFGYKLELSAGIAGAVGFLVTFIWFMVFLGRNKWNFMVDSTFMRFMAVIASLATLAINMFTAKKCKVKQTGAEVANNIIWSSALPVAAVTSVFAIIIIVIGIIILLTIKATGEAANDMIKEDQKYYGDGKLTATGEGLHKNSDGTYTSRSGKRYRDDGNGYATEI